VLRRRRPRIEILDRQVELDEALGQIAPLVHGCVLSADRRSSPKFPRPREPDSLTTDRLFAGAHCRPKIRAEVSLIGGVVLVLAGCFAVAVGTNAAGIKERWISAVMESALRRGIRTPEEVPAGEKRMRVLSYAYVPAGIGVIAFGVQKIAKGV